MQEEPPTHYQTARDLMSDEELVRKTAKARHLCPDDRWRRFRELQKKFADSADLWRQQSNVGYNKGVRQ